MFCSYFVAGSVSAVAPWVGYYGYAWRHGNTSANLDVWCYVDAVDRNERDLEIV
jgi:hypothetical protein